LKAAGLLHSDAIAEGDVVGAFNDRGACLAAARLSDRIRRNVVRLIRRRR
jgi:anaerobic selenocysteine-containing dehydrogenase